MRLRLRADREKSNAPAFVRRFKRLLRDCHAAGVCVVADSDGGTVRFVDAVEYAEANDLRRLGMAVEVDGGCGGAMPPCESR